MVKDYFCFGLTWHVTVRTDHVWDAGLSDNSVCTQVNDGLAKDQSDYKPEKASWGPNNRPNSGTKKNRSDFVIRSETSGCVAWN